MVAAPGTSKPPLPPSSNAIKLLAPRISFIIMKLNEKIRALSCVTQLSFTNYECVWELFDGLSQ
jgi:hypothetical protein